jgi:DNA-directed RNA polymerase subunit F
MLTNGANYGNSINYYRCFVVLLVIGGISNSKPVSEWSDEKLDRMHGKLLHAAQTERAVGNTEKSIEHTNKAQEVLTEIGKRMQLRDAARDANRIAERMAEPENKKAMEDLSKRTFEVLNNVMKKHNLTLPEAHEMLSKKIQELELKYLNSGLSPEAATEAAINELYESY